MAEADAHGSLRDFAEDLASLGWLRNVERPVDKDWEIACISRWALESCSEDDAYAIRFQQVVGHEMPVTLGLFGSRRHIARSLGVAPEGLLERRYRGFRDLSELPQRRRSIGADRGRLVLEGAHERRDGLGGSYLAQLPGGVGPLTGVAVRRQPLDELLGLVPGSR